LLTTVVPPLLDSCRRFIFNQG